MNRRKLTWLGFAIAALATVLALPQTVLAGPPLICHAIDIGQAKSLPWTSDLGSSQGSGRADYDLNRLVADTLELLAPSAPVIVRMETLRRATLYAQKDPRVAKELLGQLRARAFDAEAGGRPDALAWFDLGYLVECYEQANWDFKKLPSGGWQKSIKPNPAINLDGYAWVQKAISLRGQDPEMEFAAALITLGGSQADHHQHAQKAMAGAKTDSLLAQNLATHFIGQGGETIGVLLNKVTTAKN
jgi:hypothetical protein